MAQSAYQRFACRLLAATSLPALAMASVTPGSAELETVEVRAERPASALNGLLGERLTNEAAPLQLAGYPLEGAAPGTQRLATAFQRDAAVGENYAIAGYYENFTVRGFTLDRGSAYRINGFVVPAEFHIPLDNIDSVEILKGVGGLHGGQISAGGSINFISKRPENVGAIALEVDGRGGTVLSGEAGQARSAPTGAGYRITAAHGELHPPQPGANGQRDLLAVSLDIRPVDNLNILADVMAQHRSQPAIPGFQLLGGTTLPDQGVRELNINRQPWSRPVENNGTMASLRAEWKISEQLRLQGGYARTEARIEDNLATPWGCNSAPYQYFCSNGDYVLYKYHASERRMTEHLETSLRLDAKTGALTHALTLGAEHIERRVKQTDLYSSTLYDGLGNALSGNIATTAQPLPDPGGNGVDLVPSKATQASAYLSDWIGLGDFRALLALRTTAIRQAPNGSDEQHVLPQLALSWQFAPRQQVYVSQARGLEFGSEAPLTAANAGSLLAPRLTRQKEIGWKGAQAGLAWSAALFRMERPYEYTQPVGSSWAGLGDYVQDGVQEHQGVDLAWRTLDSKHLRLEGSQAYIRARASGSGAFDGVQVQNVPKLSSFVRATVPIPGTNGLETYVDWIYRGGRNACRDGVVTVPGYHLFNIGASWQTQLGGRSFTAALTIRNVADRHYWRDVGEAYSADLLFPGEGRSVAASIRINL